MNDPIAVAVSILAFVVSLVSTFLTLRLQSKSGTEAALDQLGEITQKIIDTLSERSELESLDPHRRDVSYYSKLSSLNYKLSLLARQADYLIELESPIVSDVQYCLIALGLAQIGDVDTAQKYWELGIAKSPSDFYRIVNLRGYASFLFIQGNCEAGAVQYQNALKIWNDDQDFHKYHNGYTYQMWFVSEMQTRGMSPQANQYYERAKQLFESISNPGGRMSALEALEMARSSLMMGYSVPPTSAPLTSPMQPPNNPGANPKAN